MSNQELFFNEWQKLVKWFDKVKTKTGVEITDNFTVSNNDVFVNGDTLAEMINGYVYHNNMPADNADNLNWFDIHCSANRVNLQGYLLNQLYTIKEA